MSHFARPAAVLLCLSFMAGQACADPTERVSVSSAELQGNNFSKLGSVNSSVAVSNDGRFVAFFSIASNLVSGDTNTNFDVFVRDRQMGTTERVNINSAEQQATGGYSYFGDISPNGRFVAFYGSASNLVANDTNGNQDDVFVRDRQSGTTERVSVDSAGLQATGFSGHPSISADGRYIAFHSSAPNLVVGDTNGVADIFVRDRNLGLTERVSVTGPGTQVSGGSLYPSISADGRYVAFESSASTLVPSDTSDLDIFVRDRNSLSTEIVSVDSNEVQGNDASYDPAISADGRFVVFYSGATNLVAGDTNAMFDVFLRDLVAGTTERISVDSAGGNSNGHSSFPSISADGRYVSFESQASDLVLGDTNAKNDIFVRDRLTGITRRANISSAGAQPGNSVSYLRNSISGDGQFVAFESDATTLVTGDTNGKADVFIRDLNGQNDVLGDFGAMGIHQYLNNLLWANVDARNGILVAAGDLDGNGRDEAIAILPGGGVFARYNNAGIFIRKGTFAGGVRVASGDLDGNGKDEVIVDRGAAGLAVLRNNSNTLANLRAWAAQGLAVGDLDNNRREDVAVDFGTRGLWVLYNNALWRQLHTGNPTYVAVGDLDSNGKDELIADRGAGATGGIWVSYNNGGSWVRVLNATSQGLATGDLDGGGRDELLVDRGTTGFFARFNNAGGFLRLHTASPTSVATSDLDGNGKEEVIAGFGAAGVSVRYNNAGAWIPISTNVVQGLTTGGFD